MNYNVGIIKKIGSKSELNISINSDDLNKTDDSDLLTACINELIELIKVSDEGKIQKRDAALTDLIKILEK